MSNIPLISVVIPAYNHEKFIGETLSSVLVQTVDDFEIIVVDDGSKDKTGDVVQGFEDPRIKYVWQENQDAYNTLNRGMSMAKGRYISILNSDDVYTPNRFEVILDYAQHEKVDCAFSDVIPISDDSKVFHDADFGWNVWHKKNREMYMQCKDLYAAFLHGNFMVTTSNLFMTAEAARLVGDFAPLRYLHDYDFIFRMMLAHPDGVHYLQNDKLLYYRIHEGNTLSEAAITGREQDLAVIEKYMLAKLPEKWQVYAQVGSKRLRSLENELHEVRTELAQIQAGHVPAKPSLLRRVLRRVRNQLS